jgi:hypothetical protein
MPTLEAQDYERFSIDDANSQPMSLDEAVTRAGELRKGDSSHFYRVEVIDTASNSFRVDKVSVTSVYADFVGRLARTIGRHAGLYRRVR